MSRLRRKLDAGSSVGSTIESLMRDGAAPATVEPLSDLSMPEARYLREQWDEWPLALRQSTVSQMASLGDEDVRLNFERALLVAMTDADADVRLSAVAALWESESATFLDALLQQVAAEPSARVRAAMVDALGRFAKLANEELIPAAQRDRIEIVLVDILEDSDENVHLAALASAAYLRPTAIEQRIVDAYDEGHDEAREIALRAMGRYGGNQWATRVIDSMRAGDTDQRTEAARAAPYIEDRRVVAYLYEAAEDDEEEALQFAAIEALGEIGGRDIRSFLESLRDSTTGKISEAAETALANAQLLEGAGEDS